MKILVLATILAAFTLVGCDPEPLDIEELDTAALEQVAEDVVAEIEAAVEDTEVAEEEAAEIIADAVAGLADDDVEFEAEVEEVVEEDVAPFGESAAPYTVVEGDTLRSISEDHYGRADDWTIIFDENRDVISDADKIYPGQLLRIPYTRRSGL